MGMYSSNLAAVINPNIVLVQKKKKKKHFRWYGLMGLAQTRQYGLGPDSIHSEYGPWPRENTHSLIYKKHFRVTKVYYKIQNIYKETHIRLWSLNSNTKLNWLKIKISHENLWLQNYKKKLGVRKKKKKKKTQKSCTYLIFQRFREGSILFYVSSSCNLQ